MRTLRTFVLGMVAGAIFLYVLLWRYQALVPPPARLPAAPSPTASPSPALSAAPPGSIAAPPTSAMEPMPSPVVSPPSHEPGESTDQFIRDNPLGTTRPDVMFSPAAAPGDLSRLQARDLGFPVAGYDRHQLRDNFAEMRGTQVHEALDLLAPRGTPVLAVDEGTVAKLFTSRAGGLTVYEFDRDGAYCYYYAHLDRYADGLAEGQAVRKGQTIGYVGTTGNAPANVPHLHFTIFKLGPEKHWWQGVAINPFPLWALR